MEQHIFFEGKLDSERSPEVEVAPKLCFCYIFILMIFIVYVNIYEHTVVLIFVRLACDFLDRSALFPPVEYHSLSRPLAGVLVPLVPVAACRSAFFPFVKHNSPLIPVPRVGNRPSVTRHRPNR